MTKFAIIVPCECDIKRIISVDSEFLNASSIVSVAIQTAVVLTLKLL